VRVHDRAFADAERVLRRDLTLDPTLDPSRAFEHERAGDLRSLTEKRVDPLRAHATLIVHCDLPPRPPASEPMLPAHRRGRWRRASGNLLGGHGRSPALRGTKRAWPPSTASSPGDSRACGTPLVPTSSTTATSGRPAPSIAGGSQ